MDATKVISDLCAIIEQQNRIIEDMATQLAQLDALQHEEEIAAVRQKYAEATGTAEIWR